MNFQEYAKQAGASASYPNTGTLDGMNYCILGLTGEAGEIANKFKKIIRGDKTLETTREDLIDEAGDVLWYLSRLAEHLGTTLEEVGRRNVQKLDSRRERGVIKGSGDNR